METVKVFDTWVQVPGQQLHFDVMTGDQETALKLATDHVAALGHAGMTVTAQECRLCHKEPLVMFSESQQQEFRRTGGFIVPLSS